MDRHLTEMQTLVLYLFTGTGLRCVSLAWHPTFLSAGSSGAIFWASRSPGTALLALTKLGELLESDPWHSALARASLVSSNYYFDTFLQKNESYAAHTGGLVIGLAHRSSSCVEPSRGSPLEHAARQRRALAGVTFTAGAEFRRGDCHTTQYRHAPPPKVAEVNDFLVAAQKEAISKNPKDAAAHEKLAKLYFFAVGI